MELNKKQYISLSGVFNKEGGYTVMCPCGDLHKHGNNNEDMKPFLRVSHCNLSLSYWVVPQKKLNE